MKNLYHEILFDRTETFSGAEVTVTFTRVRVIKQIRMTAEHAQTLNMGYLNGSDQQVPLLILDGEPDPAPLVRQAGSAGPS